MKILLAGGGSGGPVTPVLAVAQEIKKFKPRSEFLFIGTKGGMEQKLVSDFGIPFRAMPAAKFRRYFSLKNLFVPLVFIASLISAWRLVNSFQPDAVFSAGGFVAVPICWIAKLHKAKIIIHQQDVRISLTNKLIAPIADIITTAFEYSAKNFYVGSGLFAKNPKNRAEWVGNPFRSEFAKNAAPDRKVLNLHDKLPLLLILGGATGAVQINDVIRACLPELLKSHQVVHQTGTGKSIDFIHPDYHQYELITPFDKYATALRLADIVIARGGLSTITELSALGKIALIVPMFGTHQEENATILRHTVSAVVLDEREFNPVDLPNIVNSLKFNPQRQKLLSENISRLMPKDAAARLAKLIIKTVNGTR
ncbi:MAG: hypothetical protein A3H72_01935 [Candidatus Doudnabacteria bacterium RIFCSPLOWO2_02_FULL_48_8]|uniref:UDP-N-acetylglucosamine--N-acetylmuramyl-(pentapeptide) pyrophosphoryl-undecaprenol N-acetylglucosamine transferase n=1 Tax=Candidatus Doudnabacteria bacterium RIFCSPHIGHO2_01_FULL_46_24 TaxID=1817825 RepID=A0A1F5NUD2_9BACT|nr:MAG: hypothetical protein A2720_01375 [Candidatus Doudnabacteria bacterium RIFCSPHIGHO2_01_FULL_46_24]OGE95744.1 MAG: hypothetical protein A3H72_01935 [Candidatus Doudnabacteria bacterium RIFCSPLOWO2_02_FULL_48_8]